LTSALVAAPASAATVTLGPTATGFGGAIATVDATATATGLDVLRHGGNAVDAAVAAAATLGVTEPFVAGPASGGFFVYYDAKRHTVATIDGRETGPATMTPTYFIDPADGLPYDFQEARVSGLSTGVPGALDTWDTALRKWGTRSLSSLLQPAIGVADRGFPVDAQFRQQISDNFAAFGQFDSTKALYLPGGTLPALGTLQRNPDLAATYRQIAREGIGAFYRGPIGADLVNTVQHPPVSANPIGAWPYPIRPGVLTSADLAAYQVRQPAPTRSGFRGLSVYGMSTPSSGGTAVGEALNILEKVDPPAADVTQVLHTYLEASALAFADRGRYVGAYTSPDVLRKLISDRWAAQRACQISPTVAMPKPVAPGDINASGCTPTTASSTPDTGLSTTNMTVADRWGNVIEWTFTLEQFGGNGMVVPGRGFMLNNELTDFNFGFNMHPRFGGLGANDVQGGKRPRSSMTPTILFKGREPVVAIGDVIQLNLILIDELLKCALRHFSLSL